MLSYQHALHTLLWSESDDDGEQLSRLDATPSPELVQRIRDDWERFSEAAEAMGFDAEEHRVGPINSAEGDCWDYAAHDFILTRNGHGTGFWDSGRWVSPWDKRLTDLAHSFGELNCYVGDDGLIYGE